VRFQREEEGIRSSQRRVGGSGRRTKKEGTFANFPDDTKKIEKAEGATVERPGHGRRGTPKERQDSRGPLGWEGTPGEPHLLSSGRGGYSNLKPGAARKGPLISNLER